MSFRPAGERLAQFLSTPAGEALLVSSIATSMGIAPQMVFGPEKDAGNYAAQAALGLLTGMAGSRAGRRIGGAGTIGDIGHHIGGELGVLTGMFGGSAIEDELTEPQQDHLARQQAQLQK